MYHEVALPGLPAPEHPCPGCGEPVPRGCWNIVRRPSKERIKKKWGDGEFDPLASGDEVDHADVCPFPRVNPTLLLACDTRREVEDLLRVLRIDPGQAAGPPAPGGPPGPPG